MLSLNGGKGGFGSLLRAAGKVTNTTNKSAMRDLSGRRQRFIQQERDIAEWLEEQKTSQPQSIQSIQADFRHIKKYGRPREKRMCHKGAQCPYQWKCRFRHPNDETNDEYYDFDNNLVRQKQKQLTQKLSQRFGVSQTNPLLGMTSVSQEQMNNALTMGTLHSIQMKKLKQQQKLLNKRKKKKEKSKIASILDDNNNDFDFIDSDVELDSVSSSQGSLMSNDNNDNNDNNDSDIEIGMDNKWDSIDIVNKGVKSKHHKHNIIYSIRQDCDWYECDNCHMASYGPSWHCAYKCDFDLCDNCVNIETDIISFKNDNDNDNDNDDSIVDNENRNTNKNKNKNKNKTKMKLKSKENNIMNDKESQLLAQVSEISEKESQMISNKLTRNRKKNKTQRQKQERRLQLLGLVDNNNDDNILQSKSKMNKSKQGKKEEEEEQEDIDLANNLSPTRKSEQILKGQIHPEQALDPNEIIIDNELLFPINNFNFDNINSTQNLSKTIDKNSNENDIMNIEIQGTIDLSQFKTSKDLESVGLDALKQELLLFGLKCGGTLEQRAERLFLLKETPLNQLPKSCFAKKKKANLNKKQKEVAKPNF